MTRRRRVKSGMSTDPLPGADPVDVEEQEREAVPTDDDEVPGAAENLELPAEADEGDVVEQRTDVPGWGDDADD
jgi:hypothetical protein